MKKLVILGCGGHAKSVVEAAMDSGMFEICGYLVPTDDYPSSLEGIRRLGTYGHLSNINADGFIVAIGNNVLRRQVYEEALTTGAQALAVVSKHSHVAESVSIGPGSVVMPGAILRVDTVVGTNCIVNTSAQSDHDCRIMDHVHIAPGAVLTGGVMVKVGAFLGAGCVVIPDVTVHEWAVVGAGGVVIGDVRAYGTVVGVPAREMN